MARPISAPLRHLRCFKDGHPIDARKKVEFSFSAASGEQVYLDRFKELVYSGVFSPQIYQLPAQCTYASPSSQGDMASFHRNVEPCRRRTCHKRTDAKSPRARCFAAPLGTRTVDTLYRQQILWPQLSVWHDIQSLLGMSQFLPDNRQFCLARLREAGIINCKPNWPSEC